MRHYLHAPDETVVRDSLDSAGDDLARIRAMSAEDLHKRPGRFWKQAAASALDCARAAYALDDAASVLAFLAESATFFGTALQHDAPIHLADVQNQLSVAIILDDAAQRTVLCALPRARYTTPAMVFAEAAHCAFGAYAAIAAHQLPGAQAQLAKAVGLLQRDKLPRPVHEDIGSAVAIEQAIVGRDEAALHAAFQQRHAAFTAKFMNPLIQHSPDGLLDIVGTGLACLAREHGLSVLADSVTVPLDLARCR